MNLPYDIVCFSHLRWDAVYQRPQHLLSRFARTRRVLFVEEPVPLPAGELFPRLNLSEREGGLTVVQPHLPAGMNAAAAEQAQRKMLDRLLEGAEEDEYVLWYYTPMALAFTRHLRSALATVYDCMDELSAFRGAPPALVSRETELLERADLVFTGGRSLYDAKRHRHPAVHAFPSSVDVAHFARARQRQPAPSDQAGIPVPRLGYFGVLDERLDVDLLAAVADLRPEWHTVLIGPVAKIEAASLPRRPNLHYLGARSYDELPRYVAGWNVALIPFARNEATRFISPTKTPEYLAAGRPVVSTSIRDVVRPYGDLGLARIADTPEDVVAAVEASLAEDAGARRVRADAFLAGMSWETTWAAMQQLVDASVAGRTQASPAALTGAVV